MNLNKIALIALGAVVVTHFLGTSGLVIYIIIEAYLASLRDDERSQLFAQIKKDIESIFKA